MEYIFFLLLLVIWLIYYSINNFMMIKPSVFYLSIMVFTMVVYLTAFEKWGVHLSFAGFGITLLGFAIFAVGERIGISCSNNILKTIDLKSGKNDKFYITINQKWLWLSFFLALLTIKLCYDHAIGLALSLGTSADSEFLLGATRRALQSGEKMGATLGGLAILTNTVSYISAFIFLNNIVLGKKNFLYLILSFISLIPNFLFGGRFGLITYTYNVITMWAILLQIHHSWHYQWKIKQILKLLGIAACMLAIFLFLGSFTGKVDFDDIISPLQIYIAFPIQGIDYILDNEYIFNEIFFGEHIFARLTNLLYRIGIFEDQTYIFQPFAYFNGFSANTYSATGDWLATGGILAVVFGQLIVGLLFGISYNYIYKLRKINYFTFLYSLFGFVILDRMTAERFFNFLFDFSSILMFIIGFCMFRMLKKVQIEFQ